MLLLGIAATNSVTGKKDDGHKNKQAVIYLGPELLLNNAPPPPASNFMHFLFQANIQTQCSVPDLSIHQNIQHARENCGDEIHLSSLLISCHRDRGNSQQFNENITFLIQNKKSKITSEQKINPHI